MASMDHTAPPHSLVRNESKSRTTSPQYVPLTRSAEREKWRVYEAERAHTALAVAVIRGMLKTHKTFKRTHKKGERSGLLPLSPVQLIGLESAIDLLHHYVDVLNPEKDR